MTRCLIAAVLLGTSSLAYALSCEPSPQFQLGDQAAYRFIENGAAAVDVSIRAVQSTSIEMVFSVTEGDASYLASYPVQCGFGFEGYGAMESDLVAPLYTNFHRLREILNVTPWAFGSSNPASHINRVSNSCEYDEVAGGAEVDRCITLYEPAAQNGAIEVQAVYSYNIYDNPISRLRSKTQRFPDGTIDSIEQLDSLVVNPQSDVPEPQSVRAIVYSATTAEILWERANPADAIVSYEVHRGGETLAQLDATSFYDNNREPGVDYIYLITAIRADGQRSPAVEIIADVFGGLVPTEQGYLGPAFVPSVDVIRASVYSQTAGEIFWERVDTSIPIRYELRRNDIVLGEFDGTSYFDDDLMPGIRYDYSVFVRGPADLVSNGASVSFTTPGIASALPANINASFDIVHTVYSSSALELFWPDYQGEASTGLRYDVYQDGALIGVTGGKSFYIDGLNENQTHQFEVVVFDARNEQVALSRTATAGAGFSNSGGPTPSNPDPSDATESELVEGSTVVFEQFYASDLTAFCNEIFDQPRYQVIRNSQELNAFYQSIINCDDGNLPPAPTTDFNNAMVLMVAETIHGQIGPTIDIDALTIRGNLLSADVLRTSIGEGCAASDALSAPFKLYRVEGVHEVVDFVERLESQPACGF